MNFITLEEDHWGPEIKEPEFSESDESECYICTCNPCDCENIWGPWDEDMEMELLFELTDAEHRKFNIYSSLYPSSGTYYYWEITLDMLPDIQYERGWRNVYVIPYSEYMFNHGWSTDFMWPDEDDKSDEDDMSDEDDEFEVAPGQPIQFNECGLVRTNPCGEHDSLDCLCDVMIYTNFVMYVRCEVFP